MMWQAWWVWGAAAIVLAILEIIVPTYVFLGFALGAAVVAVLLLLGMALPLEVLLLSFAILSIGAWIAVRLLVGIRKGQVKVIHHDINDD